MTDCLLQRRFTGLKRIFLYAVFICICTVTLSWITASKAYAYQFEDGTYAVDYAVYQADNDSVSIANDYFLKPAMLTVNDGEMRIQLTVNQSEWVKELRVADGDAYKDVDVVSENIADNTRDIAFMVTQDLAEPIYMQMNIRIESMTPVYDHSYTVRYIFDVETAEEIDPPPTSEQPQEQDNGTAESSKLMIYISLILLIIIVIMIYYLVKKRRNH